MLRDWNLLSDELQLVLTREALRQAVSTLVSHAEVLASEIEAGVILDRGGPEALRLLATVVRETQAANLAPVGLA